MDLYALPAASKSSFLISAFPVYSTSFFFLSLQTIFQEEGPVSWAVDEICTCGLMISFHPDMSSARDGVNYTATYK